MRKKATFVLAFLTLAVSAAAARPPLFETLVGHYESVRQDLLHDRLEGVAAQAVAIRDAASELGHDLSPERAGVSAADLPEVEALLPEIAQRAERLARAGTLEEARAALADLTKPLVRYRKLAGDGGSVVAYCPMKKMAWLQPPGEIGNPYYGQAMPGCGNVVSN